MHQNFSAIAGGKAARLDGKISALPVSVLSGQAIGAVEIGADIGAFDGRAVEADAVARNLKRRDECDRTPNGAVEVGLGEGGVTRDEAQLVIAGTIGEIENIALGRQRRRLPISACGIVWRSAIPLALMPACLSGHRQLGQKSRSALHVGKQPGNRPDGASLWH